MLYIYIYIKNLPELNANYSFVLGGLIRAVEMYVTAVRHCGTARGIMLWNLQILQFKLSQMGTARHQFRSTSVVSVKQDMFNII